MMPASRILLQRGILLAALWVGAVSPIRAEAASIRESLHAVPDNQIIMVSEIAYPDAETVCVLQPYQNLLNPKGDASAELNARLRDELPVADEAHFTFAVFRKHGLELDRILRSRLPVGAVLPRGFIQAECASSSSAAVVKIRFRERAYIVFGEIR
jgi:hypothetical protein